jgi:hypothetical protein
MMNRLAKSLVHLYPAEWRKRYGSEFEGLVEDVPPGWSAHFDLLKRSNPHAVFDSVLS